MIMPRMDGWRLAAEINGDKTINNTRLILMTPRGLLGGDTKMTLLRWFDAYIYKPIKRQNLAEAVDLTFSEPQVDLDAAPDQEGDIPEMPPDATGKPLILIAEDHPVNQKLFSIILKKLGYPSILADDGLDVLEKASAHAVDLIFMDIQMPRMNGYEAAAQLRRQGFTKPIIAVTAGAIADEWDRCRKAGINDILLKPCKQPGVEAMFLKWLAVPRPRRSPAHPHRGAPAPPAAASLPGPCASPPCPRPLRTSPYRRPLPPRRTQTGPFHRFPPLRPPPCPRPPRTSPYRRALRRIWRDGCYPSRRYR
jgi:CheY-like chemotaxis protein